MVETRQTVEDIESLITDFQPSDFVTLDDDRMADGEFPELKKPDIESSAAEPKEVTTAHDTWSYVPSLPNQYFTHSDTTRVVDVSTQQFKMSDKVDTEKLNAIQRGETSQEPTHVIIHKQEAFFEGTFYVLITSGRIQYKQLS